MSVQFRDNLSNTRQGSANPFYGKRHTVVTKKLMSSLKSGVLNPSYGIRVYGEDNPNWRSGKTKLVRQIRTCSKYSDWRLSVFKRDNFTCTECGETNVYLECHHRKPLVTLLEEYNIKNINEALGCDILWDIGNGITVCSDCHCAVDTSRARFGVN